MVATGKGNRRSGQEIFFLLYIHMIKNVIGGDF